MDKATTVVYETMDYEKFSKLEENRILTEARKKWLIKSFSEGEIMNPIIVNEKFQIIDGQGRYEARKELGLPIYYIIDYGKGIEDCRRMNAYNRPWTELDFVESYALAGNEDYALLLETIKATRLPINRILRFANKTSTTQGSEKNLITAGRISFVERDAELVRQVLACANEISDALCKGTRHSNAFYTAVKIVFDTDGYNHERMLANCKRCRSQYAEMSKIEDQLKEFSRIYNYKAKKDRLYFEDYMRRKGSNVRTYDEQRYAERVDTSSLVSREKEG